MQPRITQVEDAEIRVFDPEPGTDDASAMYVMEIAKLGVTVRVRLVDDGEGGQYPLAVIEADSDLLTPLRIDTEGAGAIYND